MLVIIFALYLNFHLDYSFISFIVQCWISSDLKSMNYLQQKLSSTLINLMFTAIFGWSIILSAPQTHWDWWQLIPITNNTPWGKKNQRIFSSDFVISLLIHAENYWCKKIPSNIPNKDVSKYYDNNFRCVCFTHFKQVN